MQNHPKFLMQINKQEPIPRLVSINDEDKNQSHQYFSKMKLPKSKSTQKINKSINNNFFTSLQQPYSEFQSYEQNRQNTLPVNYKMDRNQNIPSNIPSQNQNKFSQSSQPFNSTSITYQQPTYNILRKQLPITQPRNYRLEVINIQKMLDIEKQEKLELQQIIKQLTVKTEKLKQVNQHLVDRLKQLQKSFVQEKIFQERQQDQKIRKATNKVYQDVEQFVRYQIEAICGKLKGQKISPLIQRKLQLFMQSMLQINQNTVEMLRISRKKSSGNTNKANSLLNSRLNDAQQKQNYFRSNTKPNQSILLVDRNTNNLNNLFDTTPNKVQKRSSKKRESISNESDRRIINNSFISSYKKRDRDEQSHIIIEQKQKSNINENYPAQYSTILKHLQEDGYNTIERQQLPLHVRFQGQTRGSIKRNILNDMNNRSRRYQLSDPNDDSFYNSKQTKKFYQTSNYRQKNFKVKQYTPNKRKKIFDKSNDRYSNNNNRNHSRSPYKYNDNNNDD